MSPRRKKAADEGASEEGALEAAPKKKRAARKPAAKRAPSKADGKTVAPFSYPGLQPEPKFSPMIDVAPKPAQRPVAAPPKQLGVDIPVTQAPPQRISIEPDIRANETDARRDEWPPMLQNGDADLSVPPKVLLQSKRVPKAEVEDILEEPEEEHEPDREDLRPIVRTGMYRKIAIGFVALALVVGALVMYVAYARAIIAVHPRRSQVTTERVLSVSESAKGAEDVAGEVYEVTVAGERSGAPSEATVTDGIATGFVTLINESGEDQTLVPTTRLLTPEGVMFRIKARVNVPAEGRLKTEAYADQPGAGGDIGPSRFTIPGLNAALQKVIYAESDASMKGGQVSSGIVGQSDIDQVERSLREELEAQAKEELEKKVRGEWSGRAYEIEDVSRFQSAAAGETSDGVTIRLSIMVRMAAFDRAKAVEIAGEDLRRGLTSDRELVGVSADEAAFELDEADAQDGTASLRVSVRGESRVSLESPLFDAAKLRGLDINAVKAYFEGIEGVERVDVKFRPFWIKRMPDLADHIKFNIEK
ncbi:MAG: hypothetical protein AAB554_01135 [Patescibacteria group bacterium]